jgi:hypothetical protein
VAKAKLIAKLVEYNQPTLARGVEEVDIKLLEPDVNDLYSGEILKHEYCNTYRRIWTAITEKLLASCQQVV